MPVTRFVVSALVGAFCLAALATAARSQDDSKTLVYADFEKMENNR